MGCVKSNLNVSPNMLPNVFFITGAPGSGKRTQVQKLVEKY